jgi:GH35 family endo-1,4-beta-xylanase
MWQGIEPKQGEWNWTKTNALVANAHANNIHLTAPLAYLAPWASAHGDSRKFPIKDMQYWRDFVAGAVTRYHNDIKYWEIWNEFNGGGLPSTERRRFMRTSCVMRMMRPRKSIQPLRLA